MVCDTCGKSHWLETNTEHPEWGQHLLKVREGASVRLSVHGLQGLHDGPFHKCHFPGSGLRTQWKKVEKPQLSLGLNLERQRRQCLQSCWHCSLRERDLALEMSKFTTSICKGLEQLNIEDFLAPAQAPMKLFNNCLRNISPFLQTPCSPLWQGKQTDRKLIHGCCDLITLLPLVQKGPVVPNPEPPALMPTSL